MRKTEPIRRDHDCGRPELTAMILAASLTAGCGGPAATLHGVLDEAEDRVEAAISFLEDTEDERNEATGTELPPCPAHYEPPPLWTGPPPYEDQVERPTVLGDPEEENALVNTHAEDCRDGGRALAMVRTGVERVQPALEDFAGYVEAIREFIDDDMTDEDLETLSEEVEAVAAARTDEDDTLQLRYERLVGWVIDRSPLVREMALRANRPGATVRPGILPERGESREVFLNEMGDWATIIELHAEAREFFRVRNDYRRRIHEGPDIDDPDEAAAGWTPLAGVWTGEYDATRPFFRDGPHRLEITFQADGATVAYPDRNCGGSLELTSTSGASGRVTEYLETLTTGRRRCRSNGTVTLDRTGEDRMRFRSGGGMGNYVGNLTRQ